MNTEGSLKLKRNLTALIDFSRILNSSTNLDFILNNVLLTCLGKFLATKGLIALKENGTISLKHTKGISEEFKEQFPELNSDLDSLDVDKLNSFMERTNLKAIENICSSNETIGFVCLGEKLNHTDYSEEDLDFLKTIINISATAIQNSTVINELKQVNRVLDSRVHRLNSLFELSKEFGLFTETTKVAKLLMFSVIGQFLVSKFAVVLLDKGTLNIMESKYDQTKLIKALSNYSVEEVDNTIKQSELNKSFPLLAEMDINLIVPMQMQGKTRGLILLGKRVNDQEYAEHDIEYIYSVGSLAIISLENKKLFLEALEKQKLEEELDIAREIQQNLLPQNIPHFDNYEISALNISSKQVGGDYYDVIQIDDDNFFITIGDVSGKGFPASLLMANIQAFLQVICRMGMNLSEATELLNNLICENTTEGRFITFFWAKVNIKEKTLRYVNAGHNLPMLIRNGKVERLGKGGMILGVMKTTEPYESDKVELCKDDVLLLFTDGISEAMNTDGEEYSEERLENLTLSLQNKSASEIKEAIKNDVQKFSSGNVQSDDITMIVLKVR